MCGIFGLIRHKSDDPPDERLLRQTITLLRHRGPDAEGYYAAPGIGLAHTRLSLLDLNPRSNQPFWDENERYCLVYNGEIYNFAELRANLEKDGAQFRTRSDTEVVLQALIHWGPEVAVPKLEGMFAFALYDRKEQSLLLARDRFGIKPLFVYDCGDAFIFASEIRAMRPWTKFEPDVLSISGFLYGFSGPTKGFTFYKNVRCVEPGGMIRIKKGGIAEYSRFFALVDFVDNGEHERMSGLSAKAVIEEVDEVLNSSVRAQLIADAPVGALCSGGLDSSIVMAIAAKYHKNLAIFHANVVGPVSEYQAAGRLARHLKLDLKAVEVHDRDFIDSIPVVTEHFGHPFYSCPHSVPYMAVCRLVRRSGTKAVLSGEAADEYFLGYSFFAPDIRKRLRIREMLRRARRAVRPAGHQDGVDYQGPSYIQAGDLNSSRGIIHALHNRFEVVAETLDIRERLGIPQNGSSAQYRATLPSLDSLGYNLRALLHRNDAMGMSASVEARFPFLYSPLARLAINMPSFLKIRFSFRALEDRTHYFYQNKWILRKVGERYLPPELFRREKRPFPINAYLRKRMSIAPEYFRNSFIPELFQLGHKEEACLLRECPHELKFKMLLLDVWARLSLQNQSAASVVDRLREHVSISCSQSASFLS